MSSSDEAVVVDDLPLETGDRSVVASQILFKKGRNPAPLSLSSYISTFASRTRANNLPKNIGGIL